jgi:hypothetical protein
MYGVRVMLDGQIISLEIFKSLPSARECYEQGRSHAYDGHFDSIAIFQVPDATDARDADSAIRSGDLVPMEERESYDITIAKIAKKVEFKL